MKVFNLLCHTEAQTGRREGEKEVVRERGKRGRKIEREIDIDRYPHTHSHSLSLPPLHSLIESAAGSSDNFYHCLLFGARRSL